MKSGIAFSSCFLLVQLPPPMRLFVISAMNHSTRFSYEKWGGMKWMRNRPFFDSRYSVTCSVLSAE